MISYSINRGIGKPAEFKGLRSQYLFIFAGGLLAVFVLFIILYMIGINQWVCIGFGVVAASALVYFTFMLNDKYGTHGLMKVTARRSHPRYIINRRLSPDYSPIKERKTYEKYIKSCHIGK